MNDNKEYRKSVENLLSIHRRRVEILKDKKEKYGDAFPPAFQIELERDEAAVAKYEEELERL